MMETLSSKKSGILIFMGNLPLSFFFVYFRIIITSRIIYTIFISASSDSVVIEAEILENDDNIRWRGEFTAQCMSISRIMLHIKNTIV